MAGALRYLWHLAAFLAALAVSYLLARVLIRLETNRRLAQPIHRLGVKSHQRKSGTPTLGGVAIVGSSVVVGLLFDFKLLTYPGGLGLVFAFLAFFAVGLFDDLKKVREKREEGLKPSHRILMELAISFVSLGLMGFSQKTTWGVSLPFSAGFLGLGFLAPLLLTFVLVGSANANNLLDGLDGLSAGVSLIALAPFIFIGLVKGHGEIALFLLIAVGAILGFLLLNMHPARIFMGDCGSLALGALLGGSAIVLGSVAELAVIGLIYVVECLSVIVQVGVFKAVHRRVFLMAPLHHHFELRGRDERRIVLFYYVVGIVLAVFGTLLGVSL